MIKQAQRREQEGRSERGLQADMGDEGRNHEHGDIMAPKCTISRLSFKSMIAKENLKMPTRSRSHLGRLKCLNSSLMLE